MTAHVDILEQEESLRRPFFGSLGIHAGIVTALALYAAWQGPAIRMGGDREGGGSTVVTPVKGLLMPRPNMPENLVAHDTRSRIQERPEPQTRQREDPDAIGFRKKQDPRKKKPALDLAEYLRQRNKMLQQPPDPSQVGSATGARASSLLFQQKPGSGGAGLEGGTLGEGFGAYEQYLRECVARNWTTADVEANVKTAPPVIAKFTVGRDGSMTGLRIAQSSGNARIDNSALRAVTACSPFRALPPGFPRGYATIEFWFQLQR